ncbi:unnamed protein product [Bursaphelenchus okinawaensis]|uniref:Uncharacterized protein n=1 Tax=Bursaphelenchus okinawaensis TaxID=465554 RepID=A0A811KTP1_9BILA|nr:unnamed protein product [Bursaphelenchus okinawaensis]CAG9111147.1 unnamed protein product [Bursaphelenchus okinawaensis]
MYQYLDEFDQSLNIRLRRERSRSVVSYKEDNDHDDEDLKKRRYSAGSRRTPVSDLTSSLSTDFFDFSSCGDRRSEKNMKFIEAVVNTTLKYHHKFVKGSGRKQANQFVWDSIIDDLLKNYPQFNAPEIRKLTQRVWAWQKNKVWYAFTHSESNTLTEMEQRIKMALLSNSSGSSMTAPLSRASSVFEGVEFDNNDEEPYGDFDAPRFSFAERKYLICEL